MDAAPAPARYERHRPEATLLYELVERHYPDFVQTKAQRRIPFAGTI